MIDPFSDNQFGGADPSDDTPGALTYEPFFGLHEKPFSLSADPRFLFKSPAHGRAFDALLAAIRRREGLIALTGEIGTGKTTLCRAALRQLNRRTFASFIPDPFVSREDLLTMLLVDFGVLSVDELKQGRLKGASRLELSYALYDFLDSLAPLQAFAVLVIDEAQHLPAPLLDEIRILSELERREKLLQVVLVGQPELRANLKRPEMRQVDHRVTVRLELSPLDREGVGGYVSHRLATAAGDGAALVQFAPAAVEEVHRGSGGVPRLINRICDRALELAHASSTRVIDREQIRTAIGEIGLEAPPPLPAATHQTRDDAAPETPPAAPAAPASLAPRRAERRLTLRPWAVAVLVAGIAAAAGVPTRAWYLRARSIDFGAVLAMLPASPRRPPIHEPSLTPPGADPAALLEAPFEPAPRYAIQVGSFADAEQAELLVADLANAGFRAHVVEAEQPSRHLRALRVLVGGYASAIAVERDLRRIRALPGCADARVVER